MFCLVRRTLNIFFIIKCENQAEQGDINGQIKVKICMRNVIACNIQNNPMCIETCRVQQSNCNQIQIYMHKVI